MKPIPLPPWLSGALALPIPLLVVVTSVVFLVCAFLAGAVFIARMGARLRRDPSGEPVPHRVFITLAASTVLLMADIAFVVLVTLHRFPAAGTSGANWHRRLAFLYCMFFICSGVVIAGLRQRSIEARRAGAV